MNTIHPAFQGHNIVLVGNFNPAIFQPAWFAAEELIRKQEAEEANLIIGHPDIMIFSLDWLRVEVDRERFIASTTMEPYDEIVRDLVLGTFKLLPHTPITIMGINRQRHFEMSSEEQWHKAGHTLAPKEIWNDVLKNPGTMSITMEESQRSDGLDGYVRVTVEPSNKVHPGIFIKVNDHFEIRNPEKTSGNKDIIDILENNWSNSYRRSAKMISMLLERLL